MKHSNENETWLICQTHLFLNGCPEKKSVKWGFLMCKKKY